MDGTDEALGIRFLAQTLIIQIVRRSVAMLYVRERRLWIWLVPQADGSMATMALSTNRKTMDGDREFEHLKLKLIGVKD